MKKDRNRITKLKIFRAGYRIVMIGILLCLAACKDNSNKRKDVYDNGKLKQTVITISDTTFYNIEYYDNGSYSSIATFNNRSMMKDGLFISFYESGIIAERGFFKKDKKNGEWLHYSKDGFLVEKEHLVALDSNEYPIVKENIFYNTNMELDTTKQLVYVEIKSFMDTIYEGESYFLKIKLYKPYFKDGSMKVILVDDHSKYYYLTKEKLENSISCEGFKYLFQIKEYKIGHNELNGVAVNYDKTGELGVPYYFSKSFYVKELPK